MESDSQVRTQAPGIAEGLRAWFYIWFQVARC